MKKPSAKMVMATKVPIAAAPTHKPLSGTKSMSASVVGVEPEVGDSEKIATDFFGLIGIYTLTETAGQRAKQLLQKLIPKSRIELNADGVATDRLKHLASSADVFVFAWRSSKHQAYYCAKAARAGKDLILPPGKGMASIVRSVLDYLKAIE